jgi:hypothetical protein
MLKPHCSNIYLRYCFAHLLRRLAEKAGLAFSILLLNLYALVFFAHCLLPIAYWPFPWRKFCCLFMYTLTSFMKPTC